MTARLLLALGPDHAGVLLTGLLAAAPGPLAVAAYEIGPGYASMLAAAGRRLGGADLLVDRHVANAAATRVLSGAPVRVLTLGGRPGSALHLKLLAGGAGRGAWLCVLTGNLIDRDAPRPGQRHDAGAPGPGTREWVALVEAAPALVEVGRAHLAELAAVAAPPPRRWRLPAAAPRSAPPVNVPEPLVGPLEVRAAESRLALHLGGTACAAALATAAGAARRRLDAFVPYAHPGARAVRGLLDALAAAARRGAAVRVLLGQPPGPGCASADDLERRGLRARVLDPLRVTTGHAKGLISDGVVLLGSPNWSAAGLGGNREALLRIDDAEAAGYFASSFEHDWRASAPAGTPPAGHGAPRPSPV